MPARFAQQPMTGLRLPFDRAGFLRPSVCRYIDLRISKTHSFHAKEPLSWRAPRIERCRQASNKPWGSPIMRIHPIAPHQRPAKFHSWAFVPDNDNEGLTGTEAEEAASALIFALGDGGDGRLDPTFHPEIGPALDVLRCDWQELLEQDKHGSKSGFSSCWRFARAFQHPWVCQLTKQPLRAGPCAKRKRLRSIWCALWGKATLSRASASSRCCRRSTICGVIGWRSFNTTCRN